ncbi:MAG: hypothetical protein KJN97_03875 [Deltaproteobacteria bacterium]|nr:hypothetical protein [Deltaproteobacteria bacterium]
MIPILFQRASRAIALLGCLAAAGCAPAGSTSSLAAAQENARAPEMNAEEHRTATQQHQDQARSYQGTPDSAYPGEVSAPYADRVTGRQDFAAEASSGIRVLRTGQHSKHAAQHQQAAELLETFEEAECAMSPGQERAACPILVAVSRVEDIRTGVRLYLVQGADTAQVVGHMRCHHAFGRVHGFDEMDACPLYLEQLRIREVEPGVVEITGRGTNRVEEIQRRSREHMVPVSEEPVEEVP